MKHFLAIVALLAAISIIAPAQNKNAPLVYDKPGDRDDSVRLVEGPRVLDVTTDSAVIEWKTSGNGANHIRYGTVPEHPDKSAYVPGGSREHRMTLTGLEPSKTYYFYIMERDQEVRQGGTGSFTTPGMPGQAAPAANMPNPASQSPQTARITNGPVVEHVDDKSAMIAWSTNVPSSSVVHYGTSRMALAQTAQAPWGQTTHRVELKNLQPNTMYFVRVESGQAQGTGTDVNSAEVSFRTQPSGSPRGWERR